jgi:uncharacterized caspase-like protein
MPSWAWWTLGIIAGAVVLVALGTAVGRRLKTRRREDAEAAEVTRRLTEQRRSGSAAMDAAYRIPKRPPVTRTDGRTGRREPAGWPEDAPWPTSSYGAASASWVDSTGHHITGTHNTSGPASHGAEAGGSLGSSGHSSGGYGGHDSGGYSGGGDSGGGYSGGGDSGGGGSF